MITYEVELNRTVQQSACVAVEARSVSEARAKALDLADDCDWGSDHTLDLEIEDVSVQ